MPKQISLKDQPTGYGYTTVPHDDYVNTILDIARQHGVNITDEMIDQEIKKKKKSEGPDISDEKKRKKLIKAFEEIQGIWADDKDFDKRQRERDKIEIAEAKRMRKAW